MAYQKKTYSKKEPTEVNLAIEGITFDLSKVSPDVYNTAHKYAVEDVRNDAEIDFIEENEDEDVSFEFNEDEYKSAIDEKTNLYIKNALGLPDNGVMLKVKSSIANDNNAAKEAAISFFSEKYNLPVLDINSEKRATGSDVRLSKAFDAYQKISDSNDYAICLDLVDNLSRYSPDNVALIFAQRPNTIAVKGFNEWKQDDYKRGVAAGEKGIQIFAPSIKTFKSAEEVEDYTKSHYLSASKKQSLLDQIQQTGTASHVEYYHSVYVYDIMQTVPLDNSKDNLQELLDKLKCIKPLQEGLQNETPVIEATANVISNMFPDMKMPERLSGISGQEYIYNTLQTYAEKLFSEKPESITNIKEILPSKNETHQLETLMGAYLAAIHIGVDEEDVLKKAAFAMNGILKDNEPLQYRQGKRAVFEKAFERAIKFSKDFNKEFDKEFDKIQDRQAEKNKDKKKEGTERE